ncbi:MAG: hypothetical protein WCS85_04065 [Candidatus Peribacteraceae bacterium]
MKHSSEQLRQMGPIVPPEGAKPVHTVPAKELGAGIRKFLERLDRTEKCPTVCW